ncbi:MAG TPA: hypothetical protein VGJ44_16050 [Kribbellaceae bacterium]|jgi:hypothetical protein
MQLLRTFTPDQYARALESWQWLDLAGKEPVCTSPFGDVVLRAGDGLWWLDALGGELSRPWESEEQMRAELDTADGQERYLLAGLAYAAEGRGLVPDDDHVYGFTRPPVLGGPVDEANVALVDFVVALNISGQIHEQIRA